MTQRPQTTAPPTEPLIVGVDWADQKHDVCIRTPLGTYQSSQIQATPDHYQKLLDHLEQLAGGRPIAICLEKARISIVYHLLFHPSVHLYLVDPKQFARYRESFSSAGAKNDLSDAALLARMLHERRDQLRPFEPDDAPTRRIGQLCRARRRLVEQRTRLVQQLHGAVKTYFPLVLQLAGGDVRAPLAKELLRRWPDPRRLRRLHPQTLRKFFRRHGIRELKTIEQRIRTIRSQPLVTGDAAVLEPSAISVRALVAQIEVLEKAVAELDQKIGAAMDRHPDAPLFRALPGAGAALAPRLLAAFGSQRDRYQNADEVAILSGIAPVTRQSGKTRHVSRRRGCSKFLRQTFHEFANQARCWCPWSRAYYQLQGSRGMAHHAALRKLAIRWIRILYRVWLTRTPYDPARYLASLRAKNHPLLAYLEQ